ncbi:MAG: hypothetical protein HY342_00640 [Candidatus Lambdaproteobacteria bacterium]|nr:hypothetical protein [Candidatus Lambdaproteobacteria bacterium]
MKNVLLLARKGIDLDQVRALVDTSNLTLFAGTGFADARRALEQARMDLVIMGAGLDLDVRLSIVRHIFVHSSGTSVHMKDRDSGPQGMLPFVAAVLGALGR